jgi:hypothetical protein
VFPQLLARIEQELLPQAYSQNRIASRREGPNVQGKGGKTFHRRAESTDAWNDQLLRALQVGTNLARAADMLDGFFNAPQVAKTVVKDRNQSRDPFVELDPLLSFVMTA